MRSQYKFKNVYVREKQFRIIYLDNRANMCAGIRLLDRWFIVFRYNVRSVRGDYIYKIIFNYRHSKYSFQNEPMIDSQPLIFGSQQNLDHSSIANQDNSSKEDQCPICSEPCVSILINNALYHKHLDSQNISYLKYFDDIMDNQTTPDTVKYKEMNLRDQQEQFMRRIYNIEEFQYKNKAISEYYKFHRDYPKLHQTGVNRIMESYYDRIKEFQYKKIKRILKQQQDISLTTQKSSSVFSQIQEEDKKSHYSNVLNDMTQNSSIFNEEGNESQVWKVLCNKIDKAYENKRFSPLQLRKTSFNQQNDDSQKTQVRNFANYLKRQQEKKQKQQKYKNFIRSNKQSRYNSIEQDNKKYSSGMPNAQNLMKTLTKKSIQTTSSKSPFFYEGRVFYNGLNLKGNIINKKTEQKTKEQSNTPSYENFQQINHPQNAFKKEKIVFNYDRSGFKKSAIKANQSKPLSKLFLQNQFDTINSRNKIIERTTQQIYKNATEDMKLRKRSSSYSSLSNKYQHFSKRGSVVNLNALKQKDFQSRNRSSSQNNRFRKEKDPILYDQRNPKNYENYRGLQRTKSSHSLRPTRSVPKFQPQGPGIHSQNELNLQIGKKIGISKETAQSLRVKSKSSVKIKNENNRYGINSDQKQTVQVGRQGMKQYSLKNVTHNLKSENNGLKNGHTSLKGGIHNLFVENAPMSRQQKELVYGTQSINSVNIDNLLNKKLRVRVQSVKTKHHKILV